MEQQTLELAAPKPVWHCVAGIVGTPVPMPTESRMRFRNDPTLHIWLARKRELLAEAEARGDREGVRWLRYVLREAA